MVEREEVLNSLLMKVKEKTEKASLKLNILKTKSNTSIWLDSSTQIVAAGTGLILIPPLPRSPLYHLPLQVGSSHIQSYHLRLIFYKSSKIHGKTSSLFKIALATVLS